MSVNASAPRLARAILLALFGTAFAAPAFAANTNPWDGDVHPSFMFYGWLPGVSLDTRIKVPTIGGGEGTVQNRSDGNILDNLAGAFMMSGDVRVGQWGFFGDFAWVKFDNEDGHKRITTGEKFAIFGGSEETHERMTETVLKTFEELKQRGKPLEAVEPKELREIIEQAKPR